MTVALLQVLEPLSFCANSSTTMTEGVQLFNLVPPSFSTQAVESLAATADFDQITAGGVTIQYANIQAIQGHQKMVLPTLTLGVGVHIQLSYVALATILGIYHPFTMAMQALLDD